MTEAQKIAQDALISQMAATLLASGGLAVRDENQRAIARVAVAQARAIYSAATDARIKEDGA
jgi:hypothetical protein